MLNKLISFLQQFLSEFLEIPKFFTRLVQANLKIIMPLLKNDEWLVLLGELLILAVMIATPFIILKITNSISKRLPGLKKRSYYSTQTRLQKVISQFTTHYFNWVMLIFTFIILEELILHTVFSNWSFVFHFLLIYGVFRLVVVFLSRSFIRYKVAYIQQNKRAKKSIYFWCSFALIYYLTSHFLVLTTQKKLLYQGFNIVFALGFIIFYLRACYNWSSETYKSLCNLPYIGGLFQFCADRKWSYILLPIFTPLALVKSLFNLLISLFSDQELLKRLSSKILKDKLKDAIGQSSNEIDKLPLTYAYYFNIHSNTDNRLNLTFPEDILGECVNHISEWIEDREEEHSMAIIGSPGSGKSTLMNQLYSSSRSKSSFETKYININKKLTTPDHINRCLESILEKSYAGGVEALLELDNELPPTVIIMDNAHNLFLAQEDGLEGLKYFISLINAETKNLFWVTAFNKHSWFYINNVLGKHRYFRHEVYMPKWSENDIAALIKKRHSFSDYSLSFDMISEILSQDEEVLEDQASIEMKFYRLLSDQARGKPGLALNLWLSALKAISYKKLQVGLPAETDSSDIFTDMQDHSLFVYSALMRHENLTIRQASKITSLPQGIVANSLKLGMERKFIIRDIGQNYRILKERVDALTLFLAKKNFIYE